MFQLLEEKVEQVFQMDAQILTEIIKRTASIKDEVVSIDEREDGLRCILNYGHTIGKTVMQLIPTHKVRLLITIRSRHRSFEQLFTIARRVRRYWHDVRDQTQHVHGSRTAVCLRSYHSMYSKLQLAS